MQEFKVDDWITRLEDNCTRQIISISENYYDVGPFIFDKDKFKYALWQPKPGEWCWFWNCKDYGSTVLSRFDKIINIDHAFDIVYTETLYKSQEWGLHRYKYCEPFVNELPSFLKEN